MLVAFKKYLPLILILLGLALLTNCNKSGGFNSCDDSGLTNIRTLNQGGHSRDYLVYTPNSLNPNIPTPVLINFHGFDGCASSFIKECGDLESVANNNNFILVVPQGVERTKGGAEWDPGDSGVEDIMENDIYFVEKLLEELQTNYNIDSMRVYAAGYSNGGMMAYGLACSLADKIAAVGVMSGTMLQGTCNQGEQTSIIHFHGTEDDVLPYQGDQNYQSISDVRSFWLNHNNISSSSLVSTQLDNGQVSLESYSGGSSNTSYELYTLNGGGHIWFTDDIGGENPNQILWNFLSAFSLDD